MRPFVPAPDAVDDSPTPIVSSRPPMIGSDEADGPHDRPTAVRTLNDDMRAALAAKIDGTQPIRTPVATTSSAPGEPAASFFRPNSPEGARPHEAPTVSAPRPSFRPPHGYPDAGVMEAKTVTVPLPVLPPKDAPPLASPPLSAEARAAAPIPAPAAPPPPPTPARPSSSTPPSVDADGLDDESTMIANRDDLAALRTLGALLPATPPTAHAGSPWQDDSESADSAAVPSPVPAVSGPPDRSPGAAASTRAAASSPPPSVAVPLHVPLTPARHREDPTLPYTRDEVRVLAERLLPASPSSAGVETPGTPASSGLVAASGAVSPAAASSTTAPKSVPAAPRALSPAVSTPPGVGANASIGTGTGTGTGTGVATPARSPLPSSKPSRWKRVAFGVGLLGAAAAGVAGLRIRNRHAAEERLFRLESGLLSAEPNAVRDALDSAALTASVSAAVHRDLRLESLLTRAVDAGSVSPGAIRSAAVTARARGVDARWSIAASVAESLAAGDRALAERTLTPFPCDDPRLALVRGRLELALGRIDAARVTLSAGAHLAPHSLALQLALADAERAASRDDEAERRLRLVLPHHARPANARLEAALASLALDALESPSGDGASTQRPRLDLARLERLEATLGSVQAAERASFDAVLARARAAAGQPTDPARLERLAGLTLAPHVALEVAALELALGRSEAARSRLEAAFTASPADARAKRLLARALAAVGRGREALGLLDPADRATLPVRARAALHASPAEARDTAAAIAALGTDASLLLRALELQLRLAAGDDAATLLARAEALHAAAPSDRDALVAFAACAAAADRWDLLAASIDPALRADPQVAAWLARAAMRQGDVRAVRAALATLDASPAAAAADTLVVRGFVQAESGDIAAALATFDTLAARTEMVLEGSAHVVGAAGRITTLLSAGRTTEARAAFQSLDDATRAHAVMALPSARIAIADGRVAEVLPWLEARAATSTVTAEMLVAYGDGLYAANSTDHALAVYREAADADGTLPEAQLGLAIVLLRSQRLDDAATQLVRCRRALDGRPRGPAIEGRYFTLLGRTLLAKGEVEEARFALRRAVQQEGVPPEAYFFLGESLAGANSPGARSAYERYLALDPNGDYASRATRAIR